MTRLLLLLGALSILPAGCHTGQDGPNGNASATTKTIEVTDATDAKSKDHYKTKVPVGSTVLVELPFQAGTGYSWSISSHSDGLSLVRMDTKALKGNLPGGPMKAIFRLRVDRPARQIARLELARPWEVDSAPARQVEEGSQDGGAREGARDDRSSSVG